MTPRKGPLESRAFPERLEAFVVDASSAPRLHGYDVESDLARHYRFADHLLLALTGELPNDACARAFEVALSFLVPRSVAEAPIHAAVISGFCGASPTGVLSTAAASLADDVKACVEAVMALAPNTTELPVSLRARSAEETASVERLRGLLRGVIDVPLLAREPRRDVAIVLVLMACGLKTQLQIATVSTIAGLPVAAAEAARRSSADFVEKYPINTPPFVYEE